MNKRVDYESGFGFVDLVNISTGEVWEVKKDTVPMAKATKQLKKYTSHHLRKYPNVELCTGGTYTEIGNGSFSFTSGLYDYHVEYKDCQNGIIQYKYTKELNNARVNAAAGTAALIAAAILAYATGGAGAVAGAPVLAMLK